ncbi:uncharacterized protein LOC143459840 isoform X2 [Clavelina lepadiformis]|uniref:uncharacterized protein LOC143459840 isoform X2 n=1 Tax=Clavelina lepadiformis TaxID=159417 RepID=UPI004041E60C
MEDITGAETGMESTAKMSEKVIPIQRVTVKLDSTPQKNENHENEKDNSEEKPQTSTSMHPVNRETKTLHDSTGQSSPASNTSNEDTDGEFELTADAMVHDFDDEATLDEEEADDDEEDSEELDDLAKESEMPLMDLIALYYNRAGDQDNTEEKESSPENDGSPENVDDDKSDKAEERKDSGQKEDHLRRLRSSTSLLSPSHLDSSDEGGDYVPPALEDWKKIPRVGDEYQVNSIPELKHQNPDYDTATDQLVWDPERISEVKVESYLFKVGATNLPNADTLAIPTGLHIRDNEDALFLLAQCDNDVDEAIRKYQWRPLPLSSELHAWSEEECQQFENGLSLYGKDFHSIHHNKVKTKSIGEVVKFYYIWKKTERYDNFNAKTRLGKKKDTLHPGITDYMDKLLDETDHSVAAVNSNDVHTMSYLPPHSHTAALQQHLLDIRTTRRNNKQSHTPGFYTDSISHDYSEMNGLLEGDYVDDIDMFDNIMPTLPANENAYSSVSLDSIDPAINVGYTDSGNFAPLSTAARCQGVGIFPGKANCNNNSRIGVASHTTGSSKSVAVSFPDKHSFRPVEPAEITPSLLRSTTSSLTRTTPLPPDVLSSIDELATAYCSPVCSTQPVSQTSVQSLPSDSTPVGSPSEPREIAALNLKRYQNVDLNDDSKRQRRDDDRTSSLAPGNSHENAPLCRPTSSTHLGSSSRHQLQLTDVSQGSNSFQSTTQSDLPIENITEAPRIVKC